MRLTESLDQGGELHGSDGRKGPLLCCDVVGNPVLHGVKMADSGSRVESRGGQGEGTHGNRILAETREAHFGAGLEGIHQKPG